MSLNEAGYSVLKDVYKENLKEDFSDYMEFEFPVNHNSLIYLPDLKWFLDAVFIFLKNTQITITREDETLHVILQKETE
jgi:hypothetical protein